MNHKTAMFPGSFDPPTNGHLNIIERASLIFDKIYVVISKNLDKKSFLSESEKITLLKELLKNYGNVEVVVWDKLLVEFAKENDIGIIIRGLRNTEDFSYEFDIAQINRELLPGLDVVFFPTDSENLFVRSSSVKVLSEFNGDISKMVPKNVAEMISSKQKC